MNGHSDAPSHMYGALVSAEEAEQLRAMAARIAEDPRLADQARLAGLAKLTVALQGRRDDEQGRVFAIMMIHGSSSGPPAQPEAMELALSGTELIIWKRLVHEGSARRLFAWEDLDRSESDRGVKAPRLSANPLKIENVEKLQDLISEMKRTQSSGLVDRARAIGYYREVMAVLSIEGNPVFLLYLEGTEVNFRSKVPAYPENKFTRWWNPRFVDCVERANIEQEGDVIINLELI